MAKKKIRVHTPFTLNSQDGTSQRFDAGEHTVDAAIADHWFVVAHSDITGSAKDDGDIKNLQAQIDSLSGSIDNLRKQVTDNFPKIEKVITSGIKGLLWLADVIGRLVYRLIEAAGDIQDWWNGLDKSTQKLIAMFSGLVVAWRVLNGAFMTSPIGIITALIGALILLYDDYKVWKEGGKSLIDWQKWVPAIDKAKEAMKRLGDKFKSLSDDVGGWQNAFEVLLAFMAGKWALGMIASIAKVGNAAGGLKSTIASIGRGGLVGAVTYGAYEYANWVDKNSGPKTQLSENGLYYKDSTVGKVIDWWSKISSTGDANNKYTAYGTQNLAVRNNNPGNLRPASGNGFRVFESAIEGWQAMRNQLMRYYTGKTTGRALQSLTDIISTWAPPNENDTSKYISDVSKWMGVNPKAALNLQNPSVMASLMQSMARKEGYADWKSPLAGQAAGASITQETNIHIHGVSDPQQAGREVADRQTGVNSRMTQSLATGPQ